MSNPQINSVPKINRINSTSTEYFNINNINPNPLTTNNIGAGYFSKGLELNGNKNNKINFSRNGSPEIIANKLKNNSMLGNPNQRQNTKHFFNPLFGNGNIQKALKNAYNSGNANMLVSKVNLGNSNTARVMNNNNLKNMNGNRLYYMVDSNNKVRPIVVFIRASADVINAQNLDTLSKILTNKIPSIGRKISNNNKRGNYQFSEKGPFGTGYYHMGFFKVKGTNNTVPTNVNKPNNNNNTDLTFGKMLKILGTMKTDNNRSMRNNLNVNKTLFKKYSRDSRVERAAELSNIQQMLSSW